VIEQVLKFVDGSDIDVAEWERGRYCPTPTIIEAAMALYNNIQSQKLPAAMLVLRTSHLHLTQFLKIIRQSKTQSHKSICLVTGVSGCGNTGGFRCGHATYQCR